MRQMKKRKISQGGRITSLDRLEDCEWVVIHGKPYHRGWAAGWNLRTAKGYIDRGVA